MAIERTAALVSLHEQLLRAIAPFEVQDGDAAAFFGEDARDRDVRWVREFRQASSFARFTPHITLGHAADAAARRADGLRGDADRRLSPRSVLHLSSNHPCMGVVRRTLKRALNAV